MKNNLEAFEDGDLSPEDVARISTDLGVAEHEVVNMNRRMSMGGDASLNVSLSDDGESGQWQDTLEDDGPLHDQQIADAQEADFRHEMLRERSEERRVGKENRARWPTATQTHEQEHTQQ